MNVGELNTLKVLRFTSVGAYLGDQEDNDVLLPNKYLSDDLEIDDDIEVFIYRDSEDRLVATTEDPYINLNEFAFLKVKEVNFYGAFVDWGLEKDLMIPFKEQHIKLEEGQYYLTVLKYDEATDRVYGTTKVNKEFVACDDQDLLNQKVEILVGDRTDLGTKVIVENKYQGLIFENNLSRPLRRGAYTEAFVYNIREDGKLDIRLEPSGYQKIDELSDKLYQVIKRKKSLKITDKSDPDTIRETVGMSKKAFKQAVGKLYKQRLIELHPDEIKLVES